MVKYGIVMVGVLSLGAGCAPADSAGTGTVTQEQPITGGQLAPAGADPTVVLMGGCTGTKIGAHRFLTAAHCSFSPGQTLSMTNTADASGGVTRTITNVLIHPSFRRKVQVGGEGYDVALVDIAELTQWIPVETHFRTTFVGTGVEGAPTGYGCDLASPSNGGKKQYGFFTTAERPNDPDLNTHSIWDPPGLPALCCGDSGGPFFVRNSADVWEVAGVAAGRTGDCTQQNPGPGESTFTRLGNVWQWINNPVENVFADAQRGFLRNLWNKCAGAPVAAAENGVAQYYCDGRNQPVDRQYWRLTAGPNGSWRIVNTARNTCLGVSGGSTAEGALVLHQTCSSFRTDQQWELTPESFTDGAAEPWSIGNYRRLRNVKSLKCLTTSGNSSNDAAALAQSTCTSPSNILSGQWWKFHP